MIEDQELEVTRDEVRELRAAMREGYKATKEWKQGTGAAEYGDWRRMRRGAVFKKLGTHPSNG